MKTRNQERVAQVLAPREHEIFKFFLFRVFILSCFRDKILFFFQAQLPGFIASGSVRSSLLQPVAFRSEWPAK